MKNTLLGLAATSADCCCVVENGELVCTITGEVLRECCCK